uniref:Uncharacterized protein n=1 Tax=Schizaphis graminum TaxID=13262 RepID=A0A2S2NTJ5_SCHGA
MTLVICDFGLLCFAIAKHIEMTVQLICSMFRKKLLDTKPFQDDTATMRLIQRYRKNNVIEKYVLLKRKMIEKETQNERDCRRSIQDILADTLDFILNTRSRYQHRKYNHKEEPQPQEASSMPFTKLNTKNLRSFQRLNTLAIDVEELETSTQQFICRKCRLQTTYLNEIATS